MSMAIVFMSRRAGHWLKKKLIFCGSNDHSRKKKLYAPVCFTMIGKACLWGQCSWETTGPNTWSREQQKIDSASEFRVRVLLALGDQSFPHAGKVWWNMFSKAKEDKAKIRSQMLHHCLESFCFLKCGFESAVLQYLGACYKWSLMQGDDGACL